MTNKKLSRLLEPNLKLYFLCMVVFAIATAWVDVLLGLVQLCAIGGLHMPVVSFQILKSTTVSYSLYKSTGFIAHRIMLLVSERRRPGRCGVR